MMNCAKESENEKDHIVIPGKSSLLESSNPLPARRQTYSDGRGRAGLYNEKGLCVGACIRQCVCASATYSIDDSAAAVPTNGTRSLYWLTLFSCMLGDILDSSCNFVVPQRLFL
ncbi:unnamed protein product [Pieris brassicae]|uniref:Uncharacterized protein n=1 Tax=Pieris brassicae TaxID=7116 RepID=A0A9P0TH56_PIEBR|nr:unnamed protein product [Pieris brassicae]